MITISTTVGDVFNPARGEKIARVAFHGTGADVDKAARAAFPAWRETPPLTRARYLFRLKEAFQENFEDIAKNIDCYGYRQPLGVFGCTGRRCGRPVG